MPKSEGKATMKAFSAVPKGEDLLAEKPRPRPEKSAKSAFLQVFYWSMGPNITFSIKLLIRS